MALPLGVTLGHTAVGKYRSLADVFDSKAPGGVRITTALEYGSSNDHDKSVSWFGPRHWCPLPIRPNSLVPTMTACGKVDAGMAFTFGTNGPDGISCYVCQAKLQDWLATQAAKKIASTEDV